MLEWISWIVIGVVNSIIDFAIFKKFIVYDKKYNKIQLFIIFLFFSFLNSIIRMCNEPYMVMLLNLALSIVMFKLIFRIQNTKITLLTLLIFIGYTIGETIFSFIFINLLNINITFFKDNFIGLIFTNFSIMGIQLIIFIIDPICKFISDILKWYSDKDKINNIMIVFMCFISCVYFIYENYIGNLSANDFLITIIFFLGILFMAFQLFKEKIDNIKLIADYDQMIKYVKTYENVIEEKNKEQHEYSNQLLLIKSMLKDSDKDIIVEIDKRLKKIENGKDYKWLENIKNIPVGGLKGLVYYKINEMLDLNINVFVDIDNNINSEEIRNICNKHLEDISKVIAIFIDNALQAAQQTDNKYVMIEAKYQKKILTLAISNTYKGTVDVEQFGQKRYSTKGKNHGYGLSIVEDILKKYKDVKHLSEFNGMYFVQRLEIQIK